MTRRHRPYRISHQQMFLALRNAAAREQHMLCYWCKRIMRTSENVPPSHPLLLTGDHLIPLHAGGMTRPGNIVAACRECNNGRHPELNRNKTPRHDKTVERHYSPFEVLLQSGKSMK